MSVGFPWGFLALAAIAPLVAAYFLRRRQKPVRVSALFLWRSPDQRAEAGPRFERFSREISLLLEILAVIAAALFLADVGCGASAREAHLVVVVDGSMSMSARTKEDGDTTEAARRAVAEAVEAADATRVTLVESGVQPRVLAGLAEAASRALSALEDWRPRGADHDLAPALRLARDIAGPGQRIVVVTDAVPEEGTPLPAEVEVRAVGAPAENAAIVSAQRTDEGDLARVTVRVANFGDAARTLTLSVRAEPVAGGAAIQQTHTADVPAGGSARIVLALRGVGPVHLALPDDALVEDGRVTLIPAPARTVGVRRVEGLDVAAVRAIERFVSVDPGTSAEGDGLVVGGRDAEADVTIGATGEVRTFVGPFFADRAHPVLEDVQLGGVVWTAGASPRGRPLLSAGDVVLLSEDDEGKLHFNIDLARSNLHRTPAWPVLMGNLVRRAREALPGLPRRHVMLGEEIPVVVTPGARHVLRGPWGERPIFGTGHVTLPPPTQPGRYELVRDGEVVDALEVLPLDPRESDLRTRSAGLREAEAGAVTTATPLRERSPWPLLAFLALLLADFGVTATFAGRARPDRIRVEVEPG